jgi:hypothetical protein
MSGDNNFLQAVHFCFISIFEGGLFYVVNGKWVENWIIKNKKKDLD